ncbi:MAG: 3-phosphoserine/phosphohydroxythreonine transaminase [Leptospiraceae bacterium]|nr:3-phosphoserine/phosphohydroxythreonine transaminase [Leptospiraceae bacterium]
MPFTERIYNFSAGPATLPTEVLETAQKEFLNYGNTGMSIMEMSHRSKEYEDVNNRAEAAVRKLYDVPENYDIMFIQGGASLQFSMVGMNLAKEGKPIDLIQTGAWTQKAEKELKKISTVNISASTESENFMRLPTKEEMKFSGDASFVYMCSNNTIFGTEYTEYPDTGSIPLVADMSSNILSKPVDISKFGLIFAGAQKNIGPSGVTLVIIRKDLAEAAPSNLPSMLQYKIHAKEKSLYNTPPTFGVYMIMLVTEYLLNKGGLPAIAKHNTDKAKLLYDTIDGLDFYYCPVKANRSLMNVNFRIKDNNEELEKKFVKEAEAAGLSGLKGHRSVGGLRASIYNAMSQQGVQKLVEFMQNFAKSNS